LRERRLPLFVEGDHLAVLDRDGNVTRLPLTGNGAVTALAPYRYTSSATSEEHGQGTQTWWRVAGWGRGRRAPGFSRSTGTLAEAGFSTGPRWERSFSLSVEWGIAALDRNGTVLLRMRPLRNLRRMRRFAADCGLAFTEQQVTDPGRLGPAPEVITDTTALLSGGARNAIETVGWLLALFAGFAVYTAVGGGMGAAIAAVVGGFVCQGLIRWLLTRLAVLIAGRSRT
jgi:hypothetical protein